MKNQVSTVSVPPYSEVVRSMIDRENDLINHRITWLTTIQGLLFATLGFAWEKQSAKVLIVILCILGIAISILQLFALISATRAICRLSDWWEANKPRDYTGPGVAGLAPRKHLISRYAVFWNWIPIFFFCTWVVILYIRAS
jgi:hypothetical protein